MKGQSTNEEIDRLFEPYTAPGSPGCALAVMVDGEIVYKQGYGLADLEHNLPILPSTVFNIGSIAKQFTAFAIALLDKEGRLSLDDDVRCYLPEMHNFGETITIRHLIHHTSGLRCTFPELLALAGWRESDVTTTADVYALLQAQRDLNYQPGTEFAYANSNYILLAQVCERASGGSFALFCEKRIFEPLGMSNTTINDFPLKIIPGRARGYYGDPQNGWLNALLADSVVGPTNLYTTVEDLAAWDENYYTGEVGGRALVERMQRPGRLNDGTVLEYAYGLEIGPSHQHRGWRLVEHGGGQGGYCGHMVRFPEPHLSVFVLFNHFRLDARDYALRVADCFLEDGPGSTRATARAAGPREGAAPVELSVVQLEEKTGKYYNAARAALRDVSYAEGRLQYQGLDLVPVGGNCFYFEAAPDSQVEFLSATGSASQRLKTTTPSGEYYYDRVESVTPTAEELAQYAGCYYSPELDLYWTIVTGDGHLVAKRRKYVDSRLMPLFADAFADDWQAIMGYPTTYLSVFERDGQGAVSGLRVSGSRVRNLKFVRQGKGRNTQPQSSAGEKDATEH